MLPIGTILLVIGLATNLFFDKGWVVFLIGIVCFAVWIILHYLPVGYLTFLIKSIDESLTAKKVIKIVERHLNDHNVNNSFYFLSDFYNEIQEKNKNNISEKERKRLQKFDTMLKIRHRIKKRKM